jgi:predicted dehydrogenase
MAKLRLAFLGFRHGHVMGLYQAALEHPRVEVTATCEEDEATRASLKNSGAVRFTHATYDDVFNTRDVDAVAVGDYFGRRGEIIARALDQEKHVIADKPICTTLSDLDLITALAAEKKRSIGCLLDLRDHGSFIAMRRLIREGAIGEVHTVNVTAQHPLMLGKRPNWYFEDRKHGGTINDIGIHAIDLIPWLTGRTITHCVAARTWNANNKAVPDFQVAAQMMLRLDNNGGVLGDLSYLASNAAGYASDQYWRVTCHGETGVIEASYNEKVVKVDMLFERKTVPADPGHPTGCLDAFLDEIDGKLRQGALTTAAVLDATRRTLLTQQAADENRTNVPLTSA